MQHLNSMGVVEMTDAEMMDVDGGVGCLLIGALVVVLLLAGACPAE